MEQKTIKDALTRAATDAEFASELTRDPLRFKEEYQLTEEQLDAISGAGIGSSGAMHPDGLYYET